MSIEAMKQWLEALEDVGNLTTREWQAVHKNKANELRQAIAEAEKQEPVAFVVDRFQGQNTGSTMPEPQVIWIGRMEIGDKLYTTPQQKQEQGEPVVFEKWHETNFVQSLEKYGDTYKNSHVRCRHEGWLGAKSNPQQRTWVGLTDEEIFETHKQVDSMQYLTFGKAIEAKLKDKNYG